MNNKIDDVLFSLLQAKENISNSKLNIDEKSYNDIVNGIDNLITDYTINNKMTNKEILDCAISLYGKKNISFFDKVKNLRPKKLMKNLKNKLNEYYKKKELKNKYEEEIVVLVKQRLKSMVDNDTKKKENNLDQDVKKEIKTNKKTFSANLNNIEKIPIFNKDIANMIDFNKVSTFIYQDEDNYYAYRKSDNLNKDENITQPNIVKFSSLNHAIVYSIDKNLSSQEIKNNFEKYKENYGNLSNYVTDKRTDKILSDENIVSVNNELKNKTL